MPEPPPELPSTMRVATWNLWWRFGPWEDRQPAIVETLRQVGPDVIGLQEIWTDDDGGQPRLLAEALDSHAVSSPPYRTDGVGMANAILSRWPILESGSALLPSTNGPSHRRILWARIDAPGGVMPFVTTHLAHRFDESELRCRQVDMLCELVASQRSDPDGDVPPVVTGDFNAVPDSDEIRRLVGVAPVPVAGLAFTDTWAQVGDGEGWTWCGDNPHVADDSAWPNRRLDYVMVSWPRPRPVGNPVRALRFGVEEVDGMVPSDHYGVAVDLVAGSGLERVVPGVVVQK